MFGFADKAGAARQMVVSSAVVAMIRVSSVSQVTRRSVCDPSAAFEGRLIILPFSLIHQPRYVGKNSTVDIYSEPLGSFTAACNQGVQVSRVVSTNFCSQVKHCGSLDQVIYSLF